MLLKFRLTKSKKMIVYITAKFSTPFCNLAYLAELLRRVYTHTKLVTLHFLLASFPLFLTHSRIKKNVRSPFPFFTRPSPSSVRLALREVWGTRKNPSWPDQKAKVGTVSGTFFGSKPARRPRKTPETTRHRTKLAIATLLAKDGTRLRTEFPGTFFRRQKLKTEQPLMVARRSKAVVRTSESR